MPKVLSVRRVSRTFTEDYRPVGRASRRHCRTGETDIIIGNRYNTRIPAIRRRQGRFGPRCPRSGRVSNVPPNPLLRDFCRKDQRSTHSCRGKVQTCHVLRQALNLHFPKGSRSQNRRSYSAAGFAKGHVRKGLRSRGTPCGCPDGHKARPLGPNKRMR